MHYCNKCGAVINNPNKPCPVCGMYLNDSMKNVTNKKRVSINIVLIVGVFITIFTTVFITNHDYNLKTILYDNGNYKFEYLAKKWQSFSNDEKNFLTLKYNDEKVVYLVFPKDVTEFHRNLDDYEIRDDLYQEYLTGFGNSTNVRYSNIMSKIKPLDNTDYYYFTADFVDVANDKYHGKAYFLYTSEGKAITILLVLDDNSNITHIEDDVYELFYNLKM